MRQIQLGRGRNIADAVGSGRDDTGHGADGGGPQLTDCQYHVNNDTCAYSVDKHINTRGTADRDKNEHNILKGRDIM